ncbi:rho GTPase-activating protein 26 [Aphelenchoides avenae]|nr:rho GTPase-activating protein 26 [Aphelenchus avenae]
MTAAGVLKPLEFSECLADSPWFRQNLHEHENALEDTSKRIKQVETQCRKLLTCAKKLSQAQKAFASAVNEFQIKPVGTTQTDDERHIAGCFREFSNVIRQIEDQRMKIVDDAEKLYLDPMSNLVERISKVVHDEKKRFEKESSRFYNGLEKHLHLSTRVGKTDFREADAQLGAQQRTFCQASLQYVSEVQSVQERLKFEFVETLSSFLYGWLSFYHVGHVIHEDFKPFLNGIKMKVQKAKESFEATQVEAEELKQKMLAAHFRNTVFPSDSGSCTSAVPLRATNSNIKQGYVYIQEKTKIPKAIGRDVLSRTWTKYYCVYSKETRIFTIIPVNTSTINQMKGVLDQAVSFKLKSCMRRASDSIDKRFCFDIIPEERHEQMTLQALSEEDRRQWLEAMDGTEPTYSPGMGPSNANSYNTMLDENGFEFVRQCLKSIEERGITEQGIYRNCGVTSKVQRLMQMALDKRKGAIERLNLADDCEWETKTISSAVKTFLRNLPEPLMTFDLHNQFINAAKMGDVDQRVGHIHFYVYRLPEDHRRMLEMVVRHLRRVADRSSENLMTVGNLGVCFGPTLLRPKEETMAAIMDIKFCNVVVEVLIANCYQIFDTRPPQQIGAPCPPKPSHSLVNVMPPANDGATTSKQSSASLSAVSDVSESQLSSLDDGSSLARLHRNGFCLHNCEAKAAATATTVQEQPSAGLEQHRRAFICICIQPLSSVLNCLYVDCADFCERHTATSTS